MSWSKTYTRTSKQEPYDSVLFCGICGMEVHVSRGGGNSDPLLVEYAVGQHLDTYHPFRYWLWKQIGWRWLVRGLA